jgi:hypothetical protein
MLIILPTKSVFYFLILSFGGAAARQSSLSLPVSLGRFELDIFGSGLLQVMGSFEFCNEPSVSHSANILFQLLGHPVY